MNKPHNQLRIIGGEWRGRKLRFADLPGLRPTPDRVRETVFNWLMPVIQGAHCLDLFAGSGAMGLEALSRGASEVVLVDTQAEVIATLREHVQLLGAKDRARIIKADALVYLTGPSQQFDVVFLDPPYHSGLLQPAMDKLEAGGWLTENAYIYFEAERKEKLPELPAAWGLFREKTAGQVGYYLARRGLSG